ncbi:MAG: hypothetical protein HDKAJFGB_03204 [Anaerolineae bacterium]|nr:hypothetical protein [Anaerolineae bacterium]
MPACPNCSFENLPSATFCANCGHPLARPLTASAETFRSVPREAERRFVTILFADLSGFTALTETRDPEAVRELINACFDLLVPIIEEHQGVVDQFVGDAIVALFGAPAAHEDDPLQACRAALEMLDAIEHLNAARNTNLGLHIGINSGMVLAGGVGSRGRQQYSVLGDAVNMASRLQDAAERGEIFVGAETYKLARDYFEFAARGTMPFKGKSEAQPVWQLLRVQENAPRHRRVQTDTPLFGRARELALLERVTREMRENEPGLRLVSILGDAGLGKSRLIEEWRSAMPDVPFLSAGSAPDSAARAYAFIAELARVILDTQKNSTETPAWIDALMGMSTPAQKFDAADSAALNLRYANALRDLISIYAQTEAWVVVCEDLHWADAASVQALRRVLTPPPNARLLVAFTSRPDPETPGWALMNDAEELPGVAAMRIHLTPLAENDAYALAASLLPGALAPEVERLIHTRAEGNPLFVQELTRMLWERGDLIDVDGKWVLKNDQAALDIPGTLQGVLMARIDQLPSNARRVLQIASVLGREFPLEVLERLLLQVHSA